MNDAYSVTIDFLNKLANIFTCSACSLLEDRPVYLWMPFRKLSPAFASSGGVLSLDLNWQGYYTISPPIVFLRPVRSRSVEYRPFTRLSHHYRDIVIDYLKVC